MLGNIWLVSIQDGYQFTYGFLPSFQLLQNAKAVRLSQRAKTPRHQIKHLAAHHLTRHCFLVYHYKGIQSIRF